MRLLFVGPPGSGKGTQCEVLSETLGVPHISTGDLLREAVRAGGIAGRRAQHFMSAGRLVPDRLVLRILEARLARPDARTRGYLLDGFPRTVAQARAFETLPGARGFDAVVVLTLPRAVVVDRLAARGRTDDTEASVRRRLEIYERVTVPMIAWCAERYPLVRVAADRPVEVVTADILRHLGELEGFAELAGLDALDAPALPPTASVGPGPRAGGGPASGGSGSGGSGIGGGSASGGSGGGPRSLSGNTDLDAPEQLL